MIVYLAHFSQPLGHARHYIGTTRNFKARMRAHRKGRGAALLRACNEQGIRWRIVRKWLGSRKLEKQLKARKDAPSLCPVCSRKRSAAQSRNRRARAKQVASEKEREIIRTTPCPTCQAAAGNTCRTIRGKIRNEITSIHPGRKKAHNENTKAAS